jgi:hypothetical protein
MKATSQCLAERLLRRETRKGVLDKFRHALASCKIPTPDTVTPAGSVYRDLETRRALFRSSSLIDAR